MLRREFLAVPTLLLATTAQARPKVGGFKFGVLKEYREGVYVMDIETKRIPRRLKDSGFRFGLQFENRDRETLKWYEEVRFPEPPRKVTGEFKRSQPSVLKTNPQTSNQPLIVDDFWFDEGDPLGAHWIDLYVNGARVFTVEYEVVSA